MVDRIVTIAFVGNIRAFVHNVHGSRQELESGDQVGACRSLRLRRCVRREDGAHRRHGRMLLIAEQQVDRLKITRAARFPPR